MDYTDQSEKNVQLVDDVNMDSDNLPKIIEKTITDLPEEIRKNNYIQIVIQERFSTIDAKNMIVTQHPATMTMNIAPINGKETDDELQQ